MRLWDVAAGDQLCALVCLEGGQDWLAVTPGGLYDGSDGGRGLMAWTRPSAGRVDDEATRKSLRREGLLTRVLKGERVR